MNTGGFFTTERYAVAGLLQLIDTLGAQLSQEEVEKKLEVFQDIETKTCIHFADKE